MLNTTPAAGFTAPPSGAFAPRCGQGGAAAPAPTTAPTPPGPPAEPTPLTFNDPLAGKSIPAIIGGMVKSLFGLAGALFLAFFIYGGVLYMTAMGSPDQVKKALKALVRAAAGLAIVLFSYTLLSLLIGLAQTSLTPASQSTTGPTAPAAPTTTAPTAPAPRPQYPCTCTCEGQAVGAAAGTTIIQRPAIQVDDCTRCPGRCNETCRPMFESIFRVTQANCVR